MRENGNWEAYSQELLFVKIFPKYPNAVFIDVEGHIGVYSISTAKLRQKVLTFEPTAETLKFLTHSIALNNLTNPIHLFTVAVMEEGNTCAISRSNSKNIGSTQVLKQKMTNSTISRAIQVSTLDNLLTIFRRENIKEAIVKMDIEVSEANAIFGGLHLLREIQIPVINMEFGWLKIPYHSNLPADKEKKLLIDRFLREI